MKISTLIIFITVEIFILAMFYIEMTVPDRSWQEEVCRLDSRINDFATRPDIMIERATIYSGDGEIVIEELNSKGDLE